MPSRLEVRDRVAHLTLNRPEAGNALDPGADPRLPRRRREPRASATTSAPCCSPAAGKNFSVGGDLRFMHDAGDDVADAVYGLASTMHAGIEALADARRARDQRRPRRGRGRRDEHRDRGRPRARRRVRALHRRLHGDRLQHGRRRELDAAAARRPSPRDRARAAQRAPDRGAGAGARARHARRRPTTRSTPRPSAGGAARRTAPIGAHGAVKRLLRCSSTSPFGQQLEDEARTIAGLSAAPDGREGVLAFLDKRAPHFGEP